MSWKKCVIAFVLVSCFCFVPSFSQDAEQLGMGAKLAGQIISNLQALKQLTMQSENESITLSENSTKLEAQIDSSLDSSKEQDQRFVRLTNLVQQLGYLVDDQQHLYKKSLNKWQLWFFGLIGLLVAYNTLKVFLKLKFKIHLW